MERKMGVIVDDRKVGHSKGKVFQTMMRIQAAWSIANYFQ